MSQISATDVKSLRDRTNQPMMDCKKALVEASGDMDKAVEILRTRGKNVVVKVAGRETGEGRVTALVEPGKIGVLLEVLFVLNIFGEIFVTTTGGPAIDTTTLTFNIYLEAFKRWNVGRASAYGVVAVIFANIITIFFLRIIRAGDQKKEAA